MTSQILFNAILIAISSQLPFNWVSFEMEKRANRDGKTSKMNAEIYFGRKELWRRMMGVKKMWQTINMHVFVCFQRLVFCEVSSQRRVLLIIRPAN